MSTQNHARGLDRAGRGRYWIPMTKSHEDDQPITRVRVAAVGGRAVGRRDVPFGEVQGAV